MQTEVTVTHVKTITVNTPCAPRHHDLHRTITLPDRCRITEQDNNNHNCEETRDLSRCVGQGRRSPHRDPSPSDPSPALEKWRSGSARRVETYGAAAGPANQHSHCKNGGRRAWWRSRNPGQRIPKPGNNGTRKYVSTIAIHIRRFEQMRRQRLQITKLRLRSSGTWPCLVLWWRKNVSEEYVATIFYTEEEGGGFLRNALYLFMGLHGIASQKNVISIFTAMKTSHINHYSSSFVHTKRISTIEIGVWPYR